MNTPSTPPRLMRGATGSTDGASGYVPPSSAGDQAKLLLGAGTWSTQALNYLGEVAGGAIPGAGTVNAGDFYYINATGGAFTAGNWAISNGTAWTEVGSIAGVLPKASQTTVDAGTAVDEYVAPDTLHGYVNPQFAARAPRQLVISDGTGPVGTTQDNAGLAFGTNDLTIGMWVRLPDWTPPGNVNLVSSDTGTAGFQFYITVTGDIRFYNRTAAVPTESTVPTGISDGDLAFLVGVLDRSANATFYVNGVQLGDPVDMSATAGDSITSTEALNWFSYSTSYTTGDLGECFISSDLATASQIAAIAKAGTAVGSGLTMLQHLVPQVAGQTDILLEDVSGNNQHALLGTSGISWQVPLPEYSEPAVPALRSDGEANAQVINTLNDQDPAAGGFTVLLDVTPPTAHAGVEDQFHLSSSSTAAVTAYGFRVFARSDGDLVMRLYGATTGDYISRELSTLFVSLLGKRTQFLIGRDTSSGFFIYARHGGQVYDVTNLTVETTAGTAPAWATGSVTGTYFGRGCTGSEIPTDDLHDLRLFNFAPTLAEAEEIFAGNIPAKWAGGDSNMLSDKNGDFEENVGAEPNDWNDSGNHVSTAVADGTAPTGANVAEVVASGAGAWSSDAFYNGGGPDRIVGTGYRVRFWAKSISGSTSLTLSGNFSGSHTLTTSWAEYESPVWEATTTGTLTIAFYLGASGTVRFDDVRMISTGETVALDLQDGGGFQPKNSRAENGSSDWLMSASGVEYIGPRNDHTINIAGEDMTADGYILADQVITPTDYELVGAYAFQTGTATSTITVKETSSGGTTVATAALSASDARIPLTVSNGLLAGSGKKLHLANSSWGGNTVTPFFVFRRAS